MKNAPKRIYLQIDDEVPQDADFNDLETSWCDDKINDRDIEYVRADRIRDRLEKANHHIKEFKKAGEHKQVAPGVRGVGTMRLEDIRSALLFALNEEK